MNEIQLFRSVKYCKSVVKSLLFFTMLFVSSFSFSQLIQSYGFSQSQETYTELDNPIIIAEATAQSGEGVIDDNVYTLPDGTIPFDFSFNGVNYTGLNVYANGFITFGSIIIGNTQPLSSSVAYDGVIAPFSGGDLIALHNQGGLTGSIFYEVIGSAPNREFVVQWKHFTIYNSMGYTANRYNFNFQTRLHENGTIKFIYDASVVGNPTSVSTRVGLRGALNSHYTTRSASGTVLSNWSSTITGTSSTSGIFTNSSYLPPSGLTFTFTPPSECIAPTEHPTDLVLTNTGIVINGSFANSNPVSDSYLILRNIQGENPNLPNNGVTYSIGQNTDLNAYVAYYGSNTTFENNYNNGIRGNNIYTYTIYSVSSNCSGGPLYLLDNPLTETITNCPIAPSGITVGTTTENSFVLNWTLGENGNALPMNRVIEVATDSNFTNMVTGSPFTLSSSDLTLTVSGLNANTQYFYRAKNTTSLCESAYSTVTSLYTSCIAVLDFSENFDNVPTVNFSLQFPNCWSRITVGSGSSTPTVNITPTYHNSAPNGITFYGNGADMADLNSKAILVSPQLTNVGAGTHRLRFNAKMSSSGGTYDLQVVALSSNTADATIELIGTITASQLTPNYQEFSVNFNNYSGTANYVGIRRINGNTWSYLCVDDVVWEEIPSCPEVYGLDVDGITNNSAILSWNGVGSTYDIEYITNDQSFTGTPTVSDVTNNYLIDGLLQSNTIYKFRVRQNCVANNDGFGAWSSVFTFKTNCDPFADFTESFDSTSYNAIAPSCWNFIDGGSGSGFVDQVSGNANTGTKYYYITNSSDASGNYILVSPETNNFENGTYRVRFYAKSSTLGQSLIFGTLSNPNDASTFEAIETISLTTAYKEYSFNLLGPNSYFGFKHGLGATYRTIYIDDVVYEPQPACPDVSGLSAGVLSNSAVLSWNGLGTLYDIEYVENTQSFTDTPTVSSVENNYLLEGLLPQTTYKFRVRQNCTVNGVGVWSSVFTFTTSCAVISTFPFEEDFETTSATISCWSNQHVLGTSDWTYATGSTSNVTTAQSGTRNARFVSTSGTASPITKLVSPIFDLSELSSPKLSFYYAQPNWSNDINELKVYYRTSPSGAWVQLAHYNTSVTAWTQEILELPNPSETYQIAFEGINNYGRANVIDLVKIYEETSTCFPIFEYNADSNGITQVIFNTIDKTSPFIVGTPQYEDFSDISTDVAQGETYQISVKGPSSSFPSDVMIYIDFNQNGDFSDDGEGFYIGRIQPANPANAFTITSDIVIPNDALLGTTKMRIIKNTNVSALANPDAPNSISGPCATDLRAGQVEEYSVNIIYNCPQITTVPYLESFNEVELPVCWTTSLVSGETNWRTFDGYFEVPLFEQGGARYVNKLYNNSNALLITPEINITDMPSAGVRVNVWIYRNNDNGHNDDVVKLHVNTVPNIMDGATEILSIYAKKSIEPAVETSGWYNYTADIPENYYGNTFYVIAQGITTGGFASNGIGFDEFLIEAIPTQQIVVENIEVSVENNAEAIIAINGGTLQLFASVNPVNANQEVIWTIVSGEELATIDTNGVVTAIANGTVTVRATSLEDTTKFDEIEIIITNQGNVDIFPAPYCNIIIEYADPNDMYEIEPITYASFGDIEKSSSNVIAGTPVLENFTSEITSVNKGTTYTLTVKGNTSGSETNYIRVYIDWNQNYIFEDNESYAVGTIFNSTGLDDVFTSIEITIPMEAEIGQTRMRIVKDFLPSNTSACNDIFMGQAEDYTINIVENLPLNYCIPEVFLVNPISYVEFGTIQNPSSAEFDVSAGYEDFTDVSTDVVKGNTYILKVEGYTGGYEEYVEAYFDWNQNGEFEDSEFYEVGILQPSMGNDGVFISSEIQIPSTALAGNTRMRIYKKYFTYLDACEETDFGQVEDYTINVLESIIVEVQNVIVSTQNDVDAEISTQGGILQLVAIVNPTEANQEVIWTIVSGEEFATIDENGLVTATSNGLVTVRATSVEDNTKYDEIDVVINFSLSVRDTDRFVFKIYPNPTNDIVNIVTSEIIDRVILFDVTGKEILNQISNQLHLSQFSTGIYFIRVKFEDGSVITEKIIKN